MGSYLLKMVGGRGAQSQPWDARRPSILEFARSLFHMHGCQSAVQGALHRAWPQAKDIAE
eukprot:8086735-Pyramimonas_sp.AAC.1